MNSGVDGAASERVAGPHEDVPGTQTYGLWSRTVKESDRVVKGTSVKAILASQER